MGRYGNLKVWYIPDGIVNIFSMHKLKKKYRITYDSWERHYMVHNPKGEVKFQRTNRGSPILSSTERADARQPSCFCRAYRGSMWPRRA